MLGSEYASFFNILFEIWLIFKNCTYLLYTMWWVWTYAYLSETITIIRVIYRSITSTSFLVTLFETLGGIASRAGQSLSSFSSGSVMARESLSRVCFLLLSSCLSCGTHWVRSELPGRPPLQVPSPCCAPLPDLGSGVTRALSSPQSGVPPFKGPWTTAGQNSPLSTFMFGYVLIPPYSKSSLSKKLLLILVDILWSLLG